VGWGHLLWCFWYQLAEMHGLAQLTGHLKQPRSRPVCPMNDELELLNSSLFNGSELSSLAKLQTRLASPARYAMHCTVALKLCENFCLQMAVVYRKRPSISVKETVVHFATRGQLAISLKHLFTANTNIYEWSVPVPTDKFSLVSYQSRSVCQPSYTVCRVTWCHQRLSGTSRWQGP